MPGDGPKSRCVVILTAIPVEYQAVRAYLTDIHEEIHTVGSVYERGTFSDKERSWDVVIVEVGAGNTDTALATQQAIIHYKPILILFVGVAGGLKDVKIGDVVAATKVYGYASGKANTNFETRPDVGNSAFRMVQRARAEAKKSDWLQRIIGPKPNRVPQVRVAPIASGDQVIASTDSSVWNVLRSSYGDAVAVEMEGSGFLHATKVYPQVDALIIRGICDLVDNKNDEFHDIAARHASAFAFEILAKLDVGVLQQSGKATQDSTDQEVHVNEDTAELQQYEKTSIPAASDRGQQEVEAVKLDTAILEETDMLSPGVITNSLLREFRTKVPNYFYEIKKVCDPFDLGRDIFPDECDSAIEALDILDEHLQMLDRDAKAIDLAIKWDLDNIHGDISELKLELQKFRLLCKSNKTFVERRLYNADQMRIRAKKDDLLEGLEQLKNRLSKDAALE